MRRLHLVGAGYEFGAQLTAAAIDALAASTWIGALSVDPWTMDAVGRVATAPVDLVAALAEGPGLPCDLSRRVAATAVAQAGRGPASLLFAGHPLHHNRMLVAIRAEAAAASVDVNVVVGVSAIDNVAGALGADLVSGGYTAVDARRLVAAPPRLDPTMTTLVTCVAELATGIGSTQYALAAVGQALLRAHPPTSTLLHVVFPAAPGAAPEIDSSPLGTLAAAPWRIGHTSTLVVPPLPR